MAPPTCSRRRARHAWLLRSCLPLSTGKFDEFQTGILIYELLHQPNPLEVRAQLRSRTTSRRTCPPAAHACPSTRWACSGLAHLLLEADSSSRIRIGEAKRVLQCLLWGPPARAGGATGHPEEAACAPRP